MSARSVILLVLVLCLLHDLSPLLAFATARDNQSGRSASELGRRHKYNAFQHPAADAFDEQFTDFFYTATPQPLPTATSTRTTATNGARPHQLAKVQRKIKRSLPQSSRNASRIEQTHISASSRLFPRSKRQHPPFTSDNMLDKEPPAHGPCFHVFRGRNGVIQTPNFPHKFQTPIECTWVIDTSELASAGSGNHSIFIYLTQLYVLGGLKFTEYMYYSDDYKVPSHRTFTINEDDVTQVAWVQFTSEYLEIRFSMATLDGTHLRALDRLLDVYGFNITYEVQDKIKPFQCNTLQCRFLGHCYADRDFGSYYCSCFPGFSGSDCGHGPLCDDPHSNVCRNGGICKHIGDAAITCHCPAGYKGTKCEIPDINEKALECSQKDDCPNHCNIGKTTESSLSPKPSKASGRSGKTRYEVTIRLGENLTNFYRNSDKERRPGDHLPSLLERHLMRALRNFNITKVSDLELISNSSRLDITFHFFGMKGDSNRIREAITRMVERGRIGNITLVSNYHLFDENPPLHLLEMTISPNASIRENTEFTLSCTAQGSPQIRFHWYKDGAIVNATKSIRKMWTSLMPPETRHTYTAVLGIKNSRALDAGIYTCMVSDWNVEQCHSVQVHIKSPPRLRVDPASVTLHRGDSLRVRCLSPGNDDIKHYGQLGYSWTRNGVLFQSDPATAMWEDLYPDGSILKINNIQKSAEYSCVVSNSVQPVFKSVYITVIDRNAVQVCHGETLFGVRWATNAPGAAIITDCPKGYQGHARRVCEQRDAVNSNWLQPDFAACVQDKLLKIYNEFLALAAGYLRANVTSIIKDVFHFTLKTYTKLLPGEAGFIIDMLQEIDSYLQLRGTLLEREMGMEYILHILDKVMLNPISLNNPQQIKKLQHLTQSVALNRETIAASQLAISTTSLRPLGRYGGMQPPPPPPPYSTSLQSSFPSVTDSSSTSSTIGSGSRQHHQYHQQQQYSTVIASDTLLRSDDVGGDTGAIFSAADDNSLSLDGLHSLRIYMTSVKSLPFNLRIYGDDLFTDKLYMDIGLSPHLLSIMMNSTIFASVISYKNLNSFLPKTYFTRSNDARGTDFILASRIIQTWLFQSNRSNDYGRVPLNLPLDAGHVEIIFQHDSPPLNDEWVPICGCEHKNVLDSNWRTDLCITTNLMENITRCVCPISGTYVVLLTRRNANETSVQGSQGPMFVIISCGSCFVQALFAFLMLFPVWCSRKCATTFLKMQFCLSTSSNMAIYLLGFLKVLPENWHPIVSSSLASLLLLGVSTLIAISLVIHSDLMGHKLYSQYSKSSAEAAKSHKIKMDNKGIRPTTPSAASIGQTATKATVSQTQIINNKSSDSGSSGGSNEDSPGSNNKVSRCSAMTMAMAMAKTASGPGSAARTAGSLVKGSGATPPHISMIQRQAVTDYETDSIAGIKAAIGISWLLPLLFAISSALICNIIGKWPHNWWLEAGGSVRRPTNDGNFGHHPHSSSKSAGSTLLHNGDNAAVMQHDDSSATAAASATTQNTYDAAPIEGGATSDAVTQAASLASSWSLYQHNDGDPSTAPANSSSFTDSPSWEDVTFVGGGDGDDEDIEATSLNFIIFICVYILFIVLFCILFIILIKKLLWLLRKTRSIEQHTLPPDKNNVAQMRRLGLLCRSGCLLIMKLSTDALFLAYVNRSAAHSQLCYPFGVSCVLLGFAIVYSFVVKSESSAGKPETSAKLKLEAASKMSLGENFCAAGLISSPSLNFYDKQKISESGAALGASLLVHIPPPPQQIEMSSNMQLPLPVISQTPCYQVVVKPDVSTSQVHRSDGHHSVIVESCLVSPNKGQPAGGGKTHLTCPRNMDNSPGIGCCNILNSSSSSGGGENGDAASAQDSFAYSSSYEPCGSRQVAMHAAAQQQGLVGVDKLDILEGVTTDSSIIGIRPSSQQFGILHAYTPSAYEMDHPKPNSFAANVNRICARSPAITVTTTSVTTQTPKVQKRVTITEPTTHTFDPMLPTMVMAANAALAAGVMADKTTKPYTAQSTSTLTASATTEGQTAVPPTPPTITVTCAPIKDATDASLSPKKCAETPTTDDECSSLSGMLDRITHDLDYLLNRTTEAEAFPEDDGGATIGEPKGLNENGS